MDSAIEWPVEGWAVIATRKLKAAKPPPPPACIAVGGKGWVSLSLDAQLVQALRWKPGMRLEVRAIEEADRVFLSVANAAEGVFTIKIPPGWKAEKGAPRRYVVPLYRLGGLALEPRRSAGVPYQALAGVLQLAVPRAGHGVERETAAQPDKPAGLLRAAPLGLAPPSVRGGIDFKSLVDRALSLAAEEWIGRTNDRSQRIVAAVALVKLGEDSAAVRQALGVENTLLPEIEDMPNPARLVAGKVFAALQEAVGE